MQRSLLATEHTPSTPRGSQAAPGALVSAKALVKVEKKATEQVTYDLSAGRVRRCGLPLARVGDEVRVLLQLPRGRGLVRASGRLLRPGETDGGPDFAIQFVHLAPRDEDAIHNAVAKRSPNRTAARSCCLRRDGPAAIG